MKRNYDPAKTPFYILFAVSLLAFSHPIYCQSTRRISAMERRIETMNRQAKESATAIKKYATRLKENLALPKPDDKNIEPIAEAPDGTRKSLAALCEHIYEFITNPIFESTTGINVGHSAKARQSLDAIVRLAEKIGGQP